MSVSFSSRELRDLLVAWVALGLAFAIFFAGGGNRTIQLLTNGSFGLALVVSLLTAGVGFLLHEVAHKVVAVRFNQVAEFRADYGMLAVAIMSALVGFIFAAPGAVYHRGVLTEREHGLIALAGPVTNLLLLVAFAPVLVVGVLVGSDVIRLVGSRGLIINAFLAAFNMLPLGSLDGKTVQSWSTPVFAGVLVLSILLTVGLFLFVGF
ncbi:MULTISPECIES: SpoIVFB-type metallopeptidase [unclassified Haloferax]|uniref:SpoIVFB-type metallopeptidase n=1 Tax=Haloferax TaxID=2251 RepID=UPI0002B0C131|nr:MULTISPECIES: SpoIVFB-type metallopeptidase [unclassified Haloferax]ELZ60825.1 SpoIVFB-type metallopeptidase [Haloferax sp. ATCC BAA-646]ELZ65070.1 SpoIVFB-type metallopeptidase [Haloferax sp. ATCC BAA-645]ELZ70021.1 SpoIVFB-type metallopeptidase [Haloferax sp. ATCC BAA-644]